MRHLDLALFVDFVARDVLRVATSIFIYENYAQNASQQIKIYPSSARDIENVASYYIKNVVGRPTLALGSPFQNYPVKDSFETPFFSMRGFVPPLANYLEKIISEG